MPKYRVTVNYTIAKQKELTVFAKDEAAAEDRACDIIQRWDGVVDAEASECVEE